VTQTKQQLLILGTKTLAVEIADVAAEVPGLQVVGFVENLQPERCQEKLESLPIYWVDELAALAKSHAAVCGLATTRRSLFVEQVSAYSLRFAVVVHPSARISSKSSIDEGTILSVNTVIAAYTRLGRHVFVNRGALIGHHTVIGNYVTIQPGANIAGACRIGEATYIGMGAIVIDHITVGSHSVVGAGAVVIQDVPDNAVVVGVPAKVVKENVVEK
jgi:sugar O-acyltransferase (sialic acid O-acetyltransferase NeuD family)